MKPEYWARIEQLFDGAVELGGDARAAWLEAQCAGDRDLRAEVEKLLAASAVAASGVASAVFESVRSVYGREQTGGSIGPYQILSEIGRGGMGVVYLARRNDDVFRKEVAIKVVKRGMDTDQILTRFRHERRILARLDHPYIAHILDGGSTEDGLPYLVMEHIHGQRITEYCEHRKLDLPARLELFRRVCAAVEYAHHNLVVHRDLKPSNILVDESGTPKLLDFGIAKLLDDTDGEGMTTLTREGGQLLTPRYASPEQIKGEPITTASDIYSLGAILYELLTGIAAHRITAQTPAAVMRAVREEKTVAPSVAARSSATTPVSPSRLSGDLDNILLTAMRKDVRERYGSVLQFSEDLRRYLENRPVLARPQTLRYRTGKYLRRNRAGVVSVVLVAASMMAGLVYSSYQARRAERRFQQVRQLANSMLFGVDDRIQNLAGATKAREWAVRTALEYLDNLSRDSGDDPSLLSELAEAYLKVGDVQGYPGMANLGHPNEALGSYRKALAIVERLPASDRDPSVQRLLARSYERVAALTPAEQFPAAREGFRRGIEVAQRLYASNPDPENSDLLISIQMLFGEELAGAEDWEAANRSWAAALEVAQRWVKEHPGDQASARLAFCHRWAARGMLQAGDPEGAERHARESLRIREALVASQPGNVVFRRDLMNSYQELGMVYANLRFLNLGDRAAAAGFHRRELELAEEISNADSNNVTALSDLSLAHSDMCWDLAEADPPAALQHCQQALAINQRFTGGSRRDPAFLSRPLPDILKKLGRRAEAVELLRRNAETLKRLAAIDTSRTDPRRELLWVDDQLAELLAETGKRSVALECYREAVALAEGLAQAQPSDLAVRRDLADTYEGLGRYFEARDWRQARDFHRKSLEIWNAWPHTPGAAHAAYGRRDRAARAVARCETALARR